MLQNDWSHWTGETTSCLHIASSRIRYSQFRETGGEQILITFVCQFIHVLQIVSLRPGSSTVISRPVTKPTARDIDSQTTLLPACHVSIAQLVFQWKNSPCPTLANMTGFYRFAIWQQ